MDRRSPINLCMVSTFDCTVDDFKALLKEMEDDISKFCSEYEIAEVNEHKAVTLCNITDMEGLHELMTHQQWSNGTKQTTASTSSARSNKWGKVH